jgi:hypothetical protein
MRFGRSFSGCRGAFAEGSPRETAKAEARHPRHGGRRSRDANTGRTARASREGSASAKRSGPRATQMRPCRSPGVRRARGPDDGRLPRWGRAGSRAGSAPPSRHGVIGASGAGVHPTRADIIYRLCRGQVRPARMMTTRTSGRPRCDESRGRSDSTPVGRSAHTVAGWIDERPLVRESFGQRRHRRRTPTDPPPQDPSLGQRGERTPPAGWSRVFSLRSRGRGPRRRGRGERR